MSEKLPDIWQGPAEAIGELLLDKKLETTAPALSQIPLLSLAIAVYKTKGAISDYLLARKVQQFYSAWERLGDSERKKVYQKFQKKPKAFVEKLLLALAAQENMEKCRLLGVLTASYLQGELKRGDYLDMIDTVTHLSLHDLLQLHKLTGTSTIFPVREVGVRYAALFVSRGLLVDPPQIPREQRSGREKFYHLTELGDLFIVQVMRAELKEAT